jgi:hypothetical protein
MKYFASRNVKYLPFGQMLRKKSVKAVALTDFIVIANLFKEKVGVKTTSSAGGSKKL